MGARTFQDAAGVLWEVFPTGWESVPEIELERLCASARIAHPARFPLKALLLERYGGDNEDPATRADATDIRRVRKWFVEAFYFERDA